jgi:hypothetical protein
VTSRGDIAMRSGLARSAFGVAGEGVKVGVISDSYNTIEGNPAATDVANGDLPGDRKPLKLHTCSEFRGSYRHRV